MRREFGNFFQELLHNFVSGNLEAMRSAFALPFELHFAGKTLCVGTDGELQTMLMRRRERLFENRVSDIRIELTEIERGVGDRLRCQVVWHYRFRSAVKSRVAEYFLHMDEGGPRIRMVDVGLRRPPSCWMQDIPALTHYPDVGRRLRQI